MDSQSKIQIALLAGRRMANFYILFLTGWLVANKIIFYKRVTDGENIITDRSRMGVSFELFDQGQNDYFNLKKDV